MMATPQKKPGGALDSSAADGGKPKEATPLKNQDAMISSAKSTPIKSPPCKKVKGVDVPTQVIEEHPGAETMEVETWQCSAHETFLYISNIAMV